MNLLAHLYLSGKSDQVMLGNLIADFLKGERAESYPDDIYRGILLHREIDSFTDRHPQVVKARKRLWSKHRHYSSVLIDIFFDHFLSKNWQDYNSDSVEEYADRVYSIISDFDYLLPKRAKVVLPRMVAGNWLVHYGTTNGISQVMQGVSKRAKFSNNLENATEDLVENYDDLENDFKAFFPEIEKHATSHLAILERKF